MSFDPARPAVTIEYCRQCRWLVRAAWMAQELLSTFEEEIGGVMLVPGAGGVFVVSVGDETVWSRKDKGRFHEIAELKRRVRDRVAPQRDLGHAGPRRRPAHALLMETMRGRYLRRPRPGLHLGKLLLRTRRR